MNVQNLDELRSRVSARLSKKRTSSLTSSFDQIRSTYSTLFELVTKLPDVDSTTSSILPRTTNEIVNGSKNQTSNNFYFFDSIFDAQTNEETNWKITILLLWIIAFLLVLFTFVNIWIYKPRKSSNVMFFHVILCEFFYLIYIFLSIMNVFFKFQSYSILCSIAKYGLFNGFPYRMALSLVFLGMYWTIPTMYLCLLLLFMERINKILRRNTICNKALSSSYTTHVLLVCIWLIIVAIALAYGLIQSRIDFIFNQQGYQQKERSISSDLSAMMNISKIECHIDGRLSPAFKILLAIVFIFLLVQSAPSIVNCCSSAIFRRICCRSETNGSRSFHWKTSFTFLSIILLNIFCSFPFYFVSSFTLIVQLLKFNEEAFHNALRITFVLRIISVILQCIAIVIVDIRRIWKPVRSPTVESSRSNTHPTGTSRTVNQTRKRIQSDSDDSAELNPIIQNHKSNRSNRRNQMRKDRGKQSANKEDRTKKFQPQSSGVHTEEINDIGSSPEYIRASKPMPLPKQKEYLHKMGHRRSYQRQSALAMERLDTERIGNSASNRSFPDKITKISTDKSSFNDNHYSLEINEFPMESDNNSATLVFEALPAAQTQAIIPVMRPKSNRISSTVVSSSRHRNSMGNEKEEDMQCEELIKRFSIAV